MCWESPLEGAHSASPLPAGKIAEYPERIRPFPETGSVTLETTRSVAWHNFMMAFLRFIHSGKRLIINERNIQHELCWRRCWLRFDNRNEPFTAFRSIHSIGWNPDFIRRLLSYSLLFSGCPWGWTAGRSQLQLTSTFPRNLPGFFKDLRDSWRCSGSSSKTLVATSVWFGRGRGRIRLQTGFNGGFHCVVKGSVAQQQSELDVNYSLRPFWTPSHRRFISMFQYWTRKINENWIVGQRRMKWLCSNLHSICI